MNLPKESAESNQLLVAEEVIRSDLGSRMRGKGGLRQVLVHQYREVDLELMVEVVELLLFLELRFSRVKC